MNRTDRLYAIAEQLRRTGTDGISAANLADYLEVSTRTIKRDISALQQSGMPIWAQTGPDGGYFLAASATLPPINFTPSQAVAVSVALAVLPAGSPFSADGSAAEGKIRDALGPRASEQAASLASRVWVQPRPEETAPAPPSVLRAIERSLTEHRTIAMTHTNAQGAPSRRTVEPTIIAWAKSSWYLVAHCQDRNDTRWFRLDRISRADLTKGSYRPRPVSEIGEPPTTARPVGPGPGSN